MEDSKKSEDGEKVPPPPQIDPKWYTTPFPHPDYFPLTRRSLQDALRIFFQPIKTEDPRVDFYTVYKKESAEHDAEYVKKYDDDLNTTLIFVRRSSSHFISHLIHSCRPVYSLQSAPSLSSTSTRTSNLIPTNNPPPSSVPSFLFSTNPPSSILTTNLPFPARSPPFRPLKKPRRERLSRRPA